mmetsp:Transcript_4534/g.18654  ORF Transcript_4534/g.18654 Transcript_4534/m.18654 type:complete len:283 (+) Transcript_4534:84-932(+)
MVSVRSGLDRRRPVAHLGGTRVSRAEHLPFPPRADLRDVGRPGGHGRGGVGQKTVEHRRVRQLQPTGHGARALPLEGAPARRARARLLGHLAARQARVRALRLDRSDERANQGEVALLVRRARVVVLFRRRRGHPVLALAAGVRPRGHRGVSQRGVHRRRATARGNLLVLRRGLPELVRVGPGGDASRESRAGARARARPRRDDGGETAVHRMERRGDGVQETADGSVRGVRRVGNVRGADGVRGGLPVGHREVPPPGFQRRRSFKRSAQVDRRDRGLRRSR